MLCRGKTLRESDQIFTFLLRRLTVAVQGPEQRGVGVVRPPTQAVVELTHGV